MGSIDRAVMRPEFGSSVPRLRAGDAGVSSNSSTGQTAEPHGLEQIPGAHSESQVY